MLGSALGAAVGIFAVEHSCYVIVREGFSDRLRLFMAAGITIVPALHDLQLALCVSDLRAVFGDGTVSACSMKAFVFGNAFSEFFWEYCEAVTARSDGSIFFDKKMIKRLDYCLEDS